MKEESKLGKFKTYYGTNPDGTRNGITYNFQSYPEFDGVPIKIDLVPIFPKGLGKDLKIPKLKFDK